MQDVLSLKHGHSVIARILRVDLRVVALGVAVMVYAVFGSPTPDVMGWVEGLVAILLLFSLGLAAVRIFVRGGAQDAVQMCGMGRWFCIGQVFLVYGLGVGVFGAIVSGASLGAIVRDVLPFGFLFLPLFLIGFVRRAGFARFYVGVFCLLGLVFAVRAAAPMYGASFSVGYEALYYLGNSPAVLFAALFFMGCGIEVLSRGMTVRAAVIAGLCFVMFAMAVVPIVMTAQRASMGAIVVYGGLMFCVMVLRAPRRMVVVGALVVAVVAALFGGFVVGAYEGVVDKSSLVGANMRFEEWRAVLGEISGHPLRVLFGHGWGATFSSPAVADIEVSYTHSLLSAMLWKVGLVGFVICLAYVGALFMALMRVFRGREVIVVAIAAPLLIDVFLYAAYKSLDFGLLLGLIPMVIFRHSGQSRIAS